MLFLFYRGNSNSMRHGHLGELSLPAGSKGSLNVEKTQERDPSEDKGGVFTFAAVVKDHS